MKRYRKMTTDQLDELLQTELRKDTPNEEVVLPILEILKEREQKPRRTKRLIISLASIAAVLALLIMVIPQTVGANSFWDVVLCVTDQVLQFFTPEESDPTEAEYAFETDNPGLQQLYDKVVEFGITDPVVPMWLPEGYKLAESKISNLDGVVKIYSLFKNKDGEIVIAYKISDEISSTQYEHLGEHVEIYEKGRVGHAIIKNAENLVAMWKTDHAECLITADVNPEDMYKVIQSIYWRN